MSLLWSENNGFQLSSNPPVITVWLQLLKSYSTPNQRKMVKAARRPIKLTSGRKCRYYDASTMVSNLFLIPCNPCLVTAAAGSSSTVQYSTVQYSTVQLLRSYSTPNQEKILKTIHGDQSSSLVTYYACVINVVIMMREQWFPTNF
jgi:hypothetical protein